MHNQWYDILCAPLYLKRKLFKINVIVIFNDVKLMEL